MKTAVVILNWNTERYLKAFLPSLVASCPDDAEVIVADSGSSDGSLDWVRTEFPGLRTIPLGANFGFTGGYNKALAQVDAEYFVLINSDIQVAPGWLEPLVGYMDAHPGCGVCGPKLHALELDSQGQYQCSTRFEYAGAAGGLVDRFGFPFCRGRVLNRVDEDRGQFDNPAEVLWVSGACMMTRSSLWHALGGLDDRFFAHMEEIDYCWKAQRLGFTVSVVPQSTVWHLGGGTLAPESPFKLKLNYRNNLLLLENNLPSTIGPVRARLLITARRLLDWGTAAVYLLSGRGKYAKAVAEAHKEYRKLRCAVAPGVAISPDVKGFWKICIILQYFTKGEGVFKYLEHYEDSHSRGR